MRYAYGSYFGDEDCIAEIDQDDIPESKKYYRESTVETVDDAEILVIKRRQMIDELNKFYNIKDYMNKIAKEKKFYHKTLLNSILNRYNNPEEAKTLIDQRMEDRVITTHMSLKQALKKNKDVTKSLS